MSPEKRQRLVFFVLAVLFHIGVFALAYRFIVFPAPAPIEDVTFQQVKIAPRPVTPPTPVTSPPMPVPNFQPASTGGSQAASNPASAVTAITMPSITPSINESANTAMTALSQLPTTTNDHPTTGTSNTANSSDGTGSGNGTGDGADNGTGRGPIGSLGVGANHIPENEKVGMIFDDSGSVLRAHVTGKILQIKSAAYPHAIYIGSPGAGGHYIPNPKNDPEADATSAIFIPQPDYLKMTWDAESKDLYAGIYISMHRGMTSVLLVSDFENDGYPDLRTDAATTAVITAMRNAHVRLYILTVELRPPQALIDYAEESGGSYSNYRQ